MKKDRNCMGAAQYPAMYGGAMPINNMAGPLPIAGVDMPMPLPMAAPTPYMNAAPNYTTSEINTLSNQINSLEQRVTNLENMVNKSYSSNYNSTNYQMM